MTPPADVPEITPIELNARLEADDIPVLLDVRELFERRIAVGALHGTQFGGRELTVRVAKPRNGRR